LKAGDRNTSLSSIMVDGSCFDSMDDMKHVIQDFYSSLFTELEPRRPKVDELFSLTHRGCEILFYEEEAYNVLRECCGDNQNTLFANELIDFRIKEGRP